MKQLGSAAVASMLLVAATYLAVAAEARAERAAEWAKLPDWSGVWWVDRPGILDTSTAIPAKADGSVPGDRTHPPYTPAYEQKYRETIEQRKQGLSVDPAQFCMPVGMPRLLSQPFGVEFHITPEITHIIWEFDAQVRRIYTDGRERPPVEELFPSWTGYSIGRWEGDTLVVDTAAIREPSTIPTTRGDAGWNEAPDQTIDRTGGILSGQHRITERIRKTANDTIEIDVTITDPVALTRPWTFKKTFRPAPAGEFVSDYIFCQSPVISGKTKFPLPTTRERYFQWLLVDGPHSPQGIAERMQRGGADSRSQTTAPE